MANRKKKQKIDTSAEKQQPLTGNPFGALDSENLDVPAAQTADLPASASEATANQPKETPRECVLRRERPPQGGKIAVVAGQFLPGEPSEELLENWRSQLAKVAACSVKIRAGELWIHADRPGDVAGFFQNHGLRVRGVTA